MTKPAHDALRWRLAGPVSFLFALIFWQALAVGLQSHLLPTPLEVMGVLIEGLWQGQLWQDLGATLGRVVGAFILALGIGTAIGIFMGLDQRADRTLDLWLILFLNIPALVVIILCYLWIGLGEVAAILAVAINKIPTVAVTVREGAKALDPGLEKLCRVYRITGVKRLRHILLPQLAPFVAASARSGLALIWKIVLVVELLGRSNGIGFQLHLAFQLFDVAGILAHSIAFMIVIWLIEVLILKPLENRARAWRDPFNGDGARVDA